MGIHVHIPQLKKKDNRNIKVKTDVDNVKLFFEDMYIWVEQSMIEGKLWHVKNQIDIIDLLLYVNPKKWNNTMNISVYIRNHFGKDKDPDLTGVF